MSIIQIDYQTLLNEIQQDTTQKRFNTKAIKVAVYYQASQSRFFMNEESFVPLVRAHGLPNVSLHFTEDTGSDTIWAGKFNEQSKLKMLGYNVQQAEGMSSGERQSLLSSIIGVFRTRCYRIEDTPCGNLFLSDTLMQ